MIAKMHTIEMLADKVLPLTTRAETDGESPAQRDGITTICRMLSAAYPSRRLEYGHRRTGARGSGVATTPTSVETDEMVTEARRLLRQMNHYVRGGAAGYAMTSTIRRTDLAAS